jgi:intracellular sulfur oxidation DsrE/DsrF family protein
MARIVLAFLLSALVASAMAQEKYNVVIQVSDNDPAKWNLALNNARNMQTDFGKGNVRVEIVAFGPGLNMMKDESAVAPRLAQALDGGVGLLACETTMGNTKTSKADIYGGIALVPSGVAHIIRRQKEGWAYIRP